MTNNEFFNTIYVPYQKTNMTPGTASVRISTLQLHFLSEFGEQETSETSSINVNTVYNDMESEGLKQNTIYGHQAALRSFFKLAIECGEATDNPVKYARAIYPEL